jgi:hypothetical protein
MWPSPLPGTFLLKLSDPDRFKNTLFVLYDAGVMYAVRCGRSGGLHTNLFLHVGQ